MSRSRWGQSRAGRSGDTQRLTHGPLANVRAKTVQRADIDLSAQLFNEEEPKRRERKERWWVLELDNEVDVALWPLIATGEGAKQDK